MDIEDHNEPTLLELTKTTVSRLSENSNPFFLMVEASFVDTGSHSNDLQFAIGEMIEADEVLNYLVNLSNSNNDINIIVTGDHETGGLDINE